VNAFANGVALADVEVFSVEAALAVTEDGEVEGTFQAVGRSSFRLSAQAPKRNSVDESKVYLDAKS
jgi:hypothetical protein